MFSLGATGRRPILRVALASCLAVAMNGNGHASEQSLSCNGALLAKGDPVESLLQKCGEPVHFQAVCVSLLQIETRPIRSDAERAVLARNCVRMDEWLYDRGPGTFTAIVRLQNRLIESVRDGQFRR